MYPSFLVEKNIPLPPVLNLDRISGILLGGALGDAMGVPFEYHVKSRGLIFTGRLEHVGYVSSAYTDPKTKNRYEATFALGQVSDDTEMALCILNSILEHKSYKWEEVAKKYLVWCNSPNTRWIGINTRKVLAGGKALPGSGLPRAVPKLDTFVKRITKLFSSESSQSNGSLMRIGPLMIFNNPLVVIQDCILTNPNMVNIGCSVVFFYTIHAIWANYTLEAIKNLILTISKEIVVIQAILDAWNGVDRDISGKDKGWCVNALYISLYCLFKQMSYPTMLKHVVSKLGDTDTNMCITGYMIGARDGEIVLRKDPITSSNLDILLSAPTSTGYSSGTYPRLPEYTLYNFYSKLSLLKSI